MNHYGQATPRLDQCKRSGSRQSDARHLGSPSGVSRLSRPSGMAHLDRPSGVSRLSGLRRWGMLVLLTLLSPAALPEPPPDTMEARVQGCATCHGPQGQGTRDDYFPRIAGKPRGYLLNQLRNFRDGRRSYPPMNYLLAYLHDDYFNEMAGYFSNVQLPFAPAEKSTLPANQLAIGAALVKSGDPAHKIPPCVSCHGPALTGLQPGIPGLIGLHSRYISAQLESWRAGTRRANAPDCMHDIAVQLSPAQITAVAAWLATQPAPTSSQPAPAGQWQPPVACGSQTP